MALSKLVFKPGINKDQTNYASEGGWYDMDKVRFRSGFPEKLGGWLTYSIRHFVGVCRSLFNWVASDGNNMMGVATNKKMYVEAGGNVYDITPIRVIYVFEAENITGVSAVASLGTTSIISVNTIPVTLDAATSELGTVSVEIT